VKFQYLKATTENKTTSVTAQGVVQKQGGHIEYLM